MLSTPFVPPTVLMVEDDPAHAWLIERNLRRGGFQNRIVCVDNGQDALDMIHSMRAQPVVAPHASSEQSEKFSTERLLSMQPLIVLLDLNMPGLNGMQVLKRVKDDPETRQIPVFILTTTDDQSEIDNCYALGCNLYLTKPLDHERFSAMVRELSQIFLMLATPSWPLSRKQISAFRMLDGNEQAKLGEKL
jgi:CheY-like chemotaxis protein